MWLKFSSHVHAVQPKLFTASEQVEISLAEEKMLESIVSVLACDWPSLSG